MSLEAFAVSTGVVAASEMGHKTQIATVMLAAKYASVLWVTAGTTLGMLPANVPVVFLGDKVMRRVPLHWVRSAAASLSALLGVLVLVGLGG